MCVCVMERVGECGGGALNLGIITDMQYRNPNGYMQIANIKLHVHLLKSSYS